ncbi:hypothetical protein SEA_ZOOMAN_151 [Microbacterium phage Zooman]|nr:hypothetical protein SEA_ZOOMAN_151 [Microbacterium phage Zooman]
MRATDLSIGDIGKTFRSITYPNNNKTAKPTQTFDRASGMWVRRPREWVLDTIYAHSNGNIKINNMFHLHADTELERVQTND